MGDRAASVLARLKNRAKEQGMPLQQLINLFCQEEFIRRLSRSRYKENLILKGGFLLYSISGFATRPTVDADYLLNQYSNETEEIEKLVREIILLSGKNDFLAFEIQSLETISKVKVYSGIRVNLVGVIGRTRTPFSIDISVGDIVIPAPVERTLPVLLSDFDEPDILTYSLESTVAEKLDAILSLMEATGRMKDFYDIYYLAASFDFDGRKLQEAIYETLTNRGRSYEKDSVIIISRLAEEAEIQKRWKNFCKKILKYELDFSQVVGMIINFTAPPYESIAWEDEFFKKWSCKDKAYL